MVYAINQRSRRLLNSLSILPPPKLSKISPTRGEDVNSEKLCPGVINGSKNTGKYMGKSI